MNESLGGEIKFCLLKIKASGIMWVPQLTHNSFYIYGLHVVEYAADRAIASGRAVIAREVERGNGKPRWTPQRSPEP